MAIGSRRRACPSLATGEGATPSSPGTMATGSAGGGAAACGSAEAEARLVAGLLLLGGIFLRLICVSSLADPHPDWVVPRPAAASVGARPASPRDPPPAGPRDLDRRRAGPAAVASGREWRPQSAAAGRARASP